MNFNEGQGRFIVIEGLDGAGTTTQAQLLQHWLLESTGAAFLTREPSSGPAGAQIRSVLTKRLNVDEETLALLFATDRLDHLYYQNNGIVHRLARNEHIVSDRYYLSSLAYQSLNAGIEWIHQLNHNCIRPDITIFLDVQPDVCMRRITGSRGFHYELYESLEKLERIRESYLAAIKYLRQMSENIHVIEGNQPVETIMAFIRERVKPLLGGDWVPPKKQQSLLLNKQTISIFQDMVMKQTGMILLSIRTIPHAYQVLFAHPEREKPIPVYFYENGTITPQGPLDIQPKLKNIVSEVHSKFYARRLF